MKPQSQKLHDEWSVRRLERLFSRYNRRFWEGRLKLTSLRINNEMSPMGTFTRGTGIIEINLAKHGSDRGVRSTLLHEMAHLAEGRSGNGQNHGTAFFVQLERLVKLEAPINMGLPENANRPLLSTIPKRFRLCRKKLKRIYETEQKKLISIEKKKGVFDVSWGDIGREFEDAGVQGLSWKSALRTIGSSYGMVDIDNKLLELAIPQLENFRRCHRRGRRQFRHLRKADQAFQLLKGTGGIQESG